MHLRRLLLTQFKNISQASLDFSEGINVLYGNNGEGKTNLLDAIYYLSVCKSALSIQDKDLIQHQAPQTTLFGTYCTTADCTEEVSCRLTRQGEKSFRRNGKTYSRLSDHLGLIPVVMVSPQDISLVFGASEERRRYMNFLLSQTDTTYLHSVQEYNKLLLQRNKLLKDESPRESVLEAIDHVLSERGTLIHQKRSELCGLLQPLVDHYYHALSGGGQQARLNYRSDLNAAPMADLLAQNRQRDFFLQYTAAGIQRDDVLFTLDEYPLRICGSQGQQKTFLLSLKLAQFALIRQLKGVAPLMLLDDVFDKLDNHRVQWLLDLVSQDTFGQIFISDSHPDRIRTLLDGRASVADHALAGAFFFHVEQGTFTYEEAGDKTAQGRP